MTTTGGSKGGAGIWATATNCVNVSVNSNNNEQQTNNEQSIKERKKRTNKQSVSESVWVGE